MSKENRYSWGGYSFGLNPQKEQLPLEEFDLGKGQQIMGEGGYLLGEKNNQPDQPGFLERWGKFDQDWRLLERLITDLEAVIYQPAELYQFLENIELVLKKLIDVYFQAQSNDVKQKILLTYLISPEFRQKIEDLGEYGEIVFIYLSSYDLTTFEPALIINDLALVFNTLIEKINGRLNQVMNLIDFLYLQIDKLLNRDPDNFPGVPNLEKVKNEKSNNLNNNELYRQLILYTKMASLFEKILSDKEDNEDDQESLLAKVRARITYLRNRLDDDSKRN